MSQYPVDTEDNLVEAVNYLLSGPVSSGQNFQGMSASGLDAITTEGEYFESFQTYFTGLPFLGTAYFRLPPDPGTIDAPYDLLSPTVFNYPAWNTRPGQLAITGITDVDPNTITVTVTVGALVNETSQPFCNGQKVVISGVTPTEYNGTYTVINYDPLLMTGNTVDLYRDTAQTWTGYTSGGVATINDSTGYAEQYFTLGNQAIVTVTGPTDRVFVSNEIPIVLYSYVKFVDIVAYNPKVHLQVNRYRAIDKTTLPDSTVIAPGQNSNYNGFVWQFDKTIIDFQKVINWDALGTQVYTTDLGNIIYNNVIDSPGIGLYLYAFQLMMISGRDTSPSDGAILLVGAETTGVRSFTAQVIKE